MARILAVLAGADMPPERLAEWAKSADLVVAADAGADRLLEAGIVPSLAIGDLDSISDEARARVPDLRLDRDQETSDCDKLLALCEELGHKGVTLTGMEGDRLDHLIATLHSAAKSTLDIRIALRKDLAHIVRGPAELRAPAHGRVSVLPITRCLGVDLEGVRWPLARVELDPIGLSSLSNQGLGQVILRLDSGIALLVLEHDGSPLWQA